MKPRRSREAPQSITPPARARVALAASGHLDRQRRETVQLAATRIASVVVVLTLRGPGTTERAYTTIGTRACRGPPCTASRPRWAVGLALGSDIPPQAVRPAHQIQPAQGLANGRSMEKGWIMPQAWVMKPEFLRQSSPR